MNAIDFAKSEVDIRAEWSAETVGITIEDDGPGFGADIERSRAEAKRLLKEAGAEGAQFELLNRNVDQPYKYIATWAIDEWSKIGLKVTQKVLPSGPFFDALRAIPSIAWMPVALLVFGAVKGRLTGAGPLKSGAQTFLVGGLAAGAAYALRATSTRAKHSIWSPGRMSLYFTTPMPHSVPARTSPTSSLKRRSESSSP
mgnify:CR=1 FL=1